MCLLLFLSYGNRLPIDAVQSKFCLQHSPQTLNINHLPQMVRISNSRLTTRNYGHAGFPALTRWSILLTSCYDQSTHSILYILAWVVLRTFITCTSAQWWIFIFVFILQISAQYGILGHGLSTLPVGYLNGHCNSEFLSRSLSYRWLVPSHSYQSYFLLTYCMYEGFRPSCSNRSSSQSLFGAFVSVRVSTR